jgi:phytoene dehydrogenase-like protein
LQPRTARFVEHRRAFVLQGRQELRLPGEVTVRRVVGDARLSRELPEREVEGAALGKEGERRIEESPAKVPVVVRLPLAHGGQRSLDVDRRNMRLDALCGACQHRGMNVASPLTASVARRRAHAGLPDHVQVAIVGSGLGGLVAAANLAQAGISVAVFEGHYVAGGCATQFARGPKRAQYHFDVGLHYIGDCGPDGQIPRLLHGVGIDDVRFRPMDAEGFDRLVFPDLEFRIPSSLDAYRERLVSRFPRERRGIDAYVRLVRSVLVAMKAMVRGARPPLRDMAPMFLAGIRLAPYRTRTMAEVFDAIGVRDKAVRSIMLGQSGDYGLPPSKVSAVLHMGLAAHYFCGAYYPEGGGQVIADRLAQRIESLGGSIHLRHPIEKILVEHGRAVGVRIAPRAGEAARDVRANVVLSNADYKKTLLELVGPEHLPSGVAAKTERAEMAAALFMTFLGVEGKLDGFGAHNIWQFDSFDIEGFYASASARSGPLTTHGCYVTSASYKDPAHALHHAPAGITNVEVMTIVPGHAARFGVSNEELSQWGYRKNERYQASKRQIEDDLIARLDRLFPGAASRVVFRESATPVSHGRYTQASDGTGYGLAATPAQFFQGRPGYRGPIEALYMCGASTRAGHGIVGAMQGGQAAAHRIRKDRLAVNTESRAYGRGP